MRSSSFSALMNTASAMVLPSLLLASLLPASALHAAPPSPSLSPPAASSSPTGNTHADTPQAESDPFQWLEAVSSPASLAWVKEHDARSLSVLESDPHYKSIKQTILALLGTKDRIATPAFRGGKIYNFWQDESHLRGLWRRTTLAGYRKSSPPWETVLDVDQLGRKEGKSWVLRAMDCLLPQETRCLLSLSEGGEDAVTIREFDLKNKAFVKDGFHLPTGKHHAVWEDENHLLVAGDWGKTSLTRAGYPYILKRLTRGHTLDEAVELYRGNPDDGGYGVNPMVLQDGQGHKLALVERPLDTFHHQTLLITQDRAIPLPLPQKGIIFAFQNDQLIIYLGEDWPQPEGTLKAGSLVTLERTAILSNPDQLRPQLLWQPGEKETIDAEGGLATRHAVLGTILHKVRGRAVIFTPAGKKLHEGNKWQQSPLPLPDNLSLSSISGDTHSDNAFISTTGFLTPQTLYLANLTSRHLEAIKTLPPQFDASRDMVEQWEATSTDGTKIPYFIVHRKDMALTGNTPVIMSAYGGFEVSETPHYSSINGKLWLERGGAYVLANIRGGGEYGPAWHEASLKTKRQHSYDDFAAVAQDLIHRKVTTPRHLGIIGGSNGGLLMGVEFVQHPELWNAVVIEIPLLDMIRISHIAAGASWEGEYGNVERDPAAMAFWRKTSPYQALRAGQAYPEPFIFTTTKDDRVGPQHARKFAAKLESLHYPFLYYENTEGGHSAGADIKQAAQMQALIMTYFYRKLLP